MEDIKNAAQAMTKLTELRSSLKELMGLDLNVDQLFAAPDLEREMTQQMAATRDKVIALIEEIAPALEGKEVMTGVWASVALIHMLLESLPDDQQKVMQMVISRLVCRPVVKGEVV